MRAWRLALVVASLFAVVLSGYWFTQVVKGASYRALADNNRLRELRLSAPRGPILDREGRTLVENVPSYHLRARRNLSRDLASSLDFAAEILDEPREKLIVRLQRAAAMPDFVPVLLAEDLSLREVARFEATGLEHPEFDPHGACPCAADRPRRWPPLGTATVETTPQSVDISVRPASP